MATPRLCDLVADAGGTTCRWAVAGSDRTSWQTAGFNACTAADDTIAQSIDDLAHNLEASGYKPRHIYFYGAGSHTPQGRARITGALQDRFGSIAVECETDLLGAARALHGHRPGVVCILGTGANAGVYDGLRLERPVAPLGYILGDEGSGAFLGKTFLQRLLRGQFPAEVTEHFRRLSDLDEAAVIEQVYRRPGANTFLGSMCPIIKELAVYQPISDMITESFKAFRTTLGQPAIERLMHTQSQNRPDAPATPPDSRPAVGFVGSVAHHFAPWLTEVFADCHLTIVADPLPRLVDYHTD